MSETKPAHRPSRRRELIRAATRVFATRGYAESSIEDVAAAAGVVPTAVYYHFGNKDEILHAAVQTAMDEFSEQVSSERASGEHADADALRRVISAGWRWWESHPDESQLIARYSQSATGRAQELRAAWEERHRERAFDYLDPSAAPRSGRAAREFAAINTLRIRALLDVILASESAALPGGVLDGFASQQLADELSEVCVRIVTGRG